MYIITATFDVEQAQAQIAEVLALGDNPERLAEQLGIMRDLDSVKQGVAAASFKRMITDVTNLKNYVQLEAQIEEIRNGKTMLGFLGSGFKDKQIAKLTEERRKFGSLIEAPRWFYQHPRVRLLSAIRDYGLDGSQQGDALWQEIDEKKLSFPIVKIFEKADLDSAQILVKEIEKPLKNINPRFLLENFEGHRSISFDLSKGVAIYYTPAPGSPG